MTIRKPESQTLLTPAEVASMFRVDPKTVTRWAKAGKLNCVRTLGGHRRYLESEVRALLEGIPAQRGDSPREPSAAGPADDPRSANPGPASNPGASAGLPARPQPGALSR